MKVTHRNGYVQKGRGRFYTSENQKARIAAYQRGEKTFMGAPCKYGHSGLRYTAGHGACVQCVRGSTLAEYTPRSENLNRKARREAKERGEMKYLGIPCMKGHSGIRYVSSGACVECRYGLRALPKKPDMIDRIEELEKALHDLDPNHPLVLRALFYRAAATNGSGAKLVPEQPDRTGQPDLDRKPAGRPPGVRNRKGKHADSGAARRIASEVLITTLSTERNLAEGDGDKGKTKAE